MLYAVSIINTVTFALFGIDKRKDVKHKRRIPEARLLTFTFPDGTAGAIVGMLRSYKNFKVAVFIETSLIIIIQGIMLYFLNWYF